MRAQPEHRTFAAALAETDPFQRAVSAAAVVSVADVAELERYWEAALRSGDELAQAVVLDAWQRRDLESFAQVVPALPPRHLLAVLEPYADGENSLPIVLWEAVSRVGLDDDERIHTEADAVLRTLLALDESLFARVADASGQIIKSYAGRMEEDAEKRRRIEDDPRSFVQAAGEFPIDERVRVLREIAREDLVEALEIAAAARSPRDRVEFQAALVPLWAEEDHAAALAWAAENLEGRPKVEALTAAIREGKWAREHPSDALEYAALIPSRDDRKSVIDTVLSDWASAVERERPGELDAFVAAVRSFPIDDLLNNGDLGIFWANADLTSAAAFLEEAPPDVDLEGFTYYVAQRFNYEKYGPDPAGGIAWAGRLTLERGREAVKTILSETSPEGLTDAVDGLPAGELKDFATVVAASNWVGDAPEATVDWVLGTGNADAVAAVKQRIETSPLEPGLKRSLLAALEAGR